MFNLCCYTMHFCNFRCINKEKNPKQIINNNGIKIYFTTLVYMSVALTLKYIYAAVIVIMITIKHVHDNNIIEAHNQ